MLNETVVKCKEIYETKKETVEWMLNFGNGFEKMQANIIKSVALGTFEA